ncbi:MAG TPA: hypothetical protein VGJ13_10105 [Pseudonocardiaceae bacterium]
MDRRCGSGPVLALGLALGTLPRPSTDVIQAGQVQMGDVNGSSSRVTRLRDARYPVDHPL